MSASVFISYASQDHATARTICDALEARGLICWISSRDIGPGENFQVSIVRAIRRAKAMVMVFSGNASNSEEIKKELVLAGQSRLVVVPVRVEDVTPDEAFAYEFATRQWVDAFDDWENSMQRLVRQLSSIPDVMPAPADAPATFAEGRPAPEVPPASAPPAARSTNWAIPGAIGVAVIALGAGAWLWLGHAAPPPVPHAASTTPGPARPPQPAVAPSNASAPVPAPTPPPPALPNPPAASPAPLPSSAAAAVPPPSNPSPPPVEPVPDFTVAGQGANTAKGVAPEAIRRAREAFERKDFPELTRAAHEAADKGNPIGQRMLGFVYLRGLGVPRDQPQSLQWFRLAADQGDAIAENNMGLFHLNGWSVPKDYAEAIRWFRKSADKGQSYGEVNLGRMYENGWGVPQDQTEAMRWFRMSADKKNPVAEFQIGLAYANGRGVTRDPDQARNWIQRAAASGNENAQRWLARH